MTTLKEIRSQYPQYDDMSDTELAERLHEKHYSDMPRLDFFKRIGMDVGEGQVHMPEHTEVGGSGLEKAVGLGEAGLSMGLTAAGEVGGGLWGGLNLLGGLATGAEDPLAQSVEALEGVRDAVSYEPQTEQGQAILENLTRSPRIEALGEQGGAAGERVLDFTGSPAAATAVDTGIQVLPELFGGAHKFRVNPRSVGRGGQSQLAPETEYRRAQEPETVEVPGKKARKEDIRQFNLIMNREGIDTRNKKQLFSSIQRIGEAVQEPGFGDSVRRVRDAVVHKKGVEENLEKEYWTQAREGGEAYVGQPELKVFRDHLDEALDGFVIEDMPKVRRLLGRFDESLKNMPENSWGRISALYRWRKSLNKNMPSNPKEPEARALSAIKGNLDHFLDTLFATDMIKGDPESIVRWKRAIDKTADIKKVFEDDRIIRQFARQDATPEQLRRFLFNADSVGASSVAQKVIQKLREATGKDSTLFTALRQESLYNVMEPLISENPNFEAFARNYEKFVKKNPSVVDELFPEESRKALKMLYTASKSADARKTFREKFGTDLTGVTATAMFGHGIAKARLRLRLAKGLMDNMISTESRPARIEMMREFYGYNPNESVFRPALKRTLGIAGTTATAEQEQE